MGYKDITPGDKIAKALGARFIKSPEKETPGIEVAFQFEEPSTGTMERLNWVGWLSPKAIERTMETLRSVLNSDGNDTVDINGVFTSPTFVDKTKEVKLVVEMESYVDKKTGEEKSAPRIQWVNNIGGSAFANCRPETVKSALAEVGFKAAFAAAGAGMPKKEVKNHAPQGSGLPGAQAAKEAMNVFDEGQVPF